MICELQCTPFLNTKTIPKLTNLNKSYSTTLVNFVQVLSWILALQDPTVRGDLSPNQREVSCAHRLVCKIRAIWVSWNWTYIFRGCSKILHESTKTKVAGIDRTIIKWCQQVFVGHILSALNCQIHSWVSWCWTYIFKGCSKDYGSMGFE